MLKETSKEDHEELARLNKRAWGYGKYYKPVYETSLKKRLYDELGGSLITSHSQLQVRRELDNAEYERYQDPRTSLQRRG